ncbi:phage major capsid protein, P2 family [Aliivibrio salmonicida]|uniref:phage major capsid protein, P2 family n=1 Tax=Aliivibrio salmonicida TaxID=40269 RepID=UPI00406CAA77
MQEATKVVLNAYTKAVAQQNGVADATQKFNVTPAATQRLIAQIRESNWFLKRINIIPVINQKGEALGLGASGMIASRTDTSNGKTRKTKAAHSVKAMPYLCEQINFDTHMRYSQLDAFAHLKNFNTIISNQIREQIDANKTTIGFYGESCEVNTDAAANPNGEDVCKGWFQAIRDHNTKAMLKQGKTANEIRIGEGGDFINLDLAVMNVKGLLHDACENDADLIAIIGSDLLAYDKAKFYAKNGNTPSEKSKIEEAQVIGTYGGLPAVSVPGFPPSGILVTSYKNLSLYIQEGSIRRSVGKQNDERDQVENFESMNIAYVIEQLEKAAAVEFDNVKLWIDGAWV